jgi:hypothetical protein
VAKSHGIPSKSIDFVLAFPQADLEIPAYMELPLGFNAPQNGWADFTTFICVWIKCVNEARAGCMETLGPGNAGGVISIASHSFATISNVHKSVDIICGSVEIFLPS